MQYAIVTQQDLNSEARSCCADAVRRHGLQLKRSVDLEGTAPVTDLLQRLVTKRGSMAGRYHTSESLAWQIIFRLQDAPVADP